MTALFFGTYDQAIDVGIPRLLVGCDQSLDESRPVIRLRGEEIDGTTLFDHTALALDNGEWDLLLDLVQEARSRIEPGRHEAHAFRLEQLAVALGRAEHESGEVLRVERLVRLLHAGDMLQLGDEGHTTIRCEGAEYVVRRWSSPGIPSSSGPIGHSHDARLVAAIALGDAHLQRTEPVVSQVRLS